MKELFERATLIFYEASLSRTLHDSVEVSFGRVDPESYSAEGKFTPLVPFFQLHTIHT